jgi:hypothetical protein
MAEQTASFARGFRATAPKVCRQRIFDEDTDELRRITKKFERRKPPQDPFSMLDTVKSEKAINATRPLDPKRIVRTSRHRHHKCTSVKQMDQLKATVAKQVLQDSSYLPCLFKNAEVMPFIHFKRTLQRDGLFWLTEGSNFLTPMKGLNDHTHLRSNAQVTEKVQSVSLLEMTSYLKLLIRKNIESTNVEAAVSKQAEASAKHLPKFSKQNRQPTRPKQVPLVFKPSSRMSSLAEQSAVRDRLLEQRLQQRTIRLKKLNLKREATKQRSGCKKQEAAQKVEIGFDLFYQ